MSRVGKKPIPVPSGVQVTIEGVTVTIKGPRGELTRSFDPLLQVQRRNGEITVARSNDERRSRALHGLTRTLINNMITGVSQGYQKSLEIVGVGYRVTQQGQGIALQVGYSLSRQVMPPPGIQLEVEGQNRVHIRGIEKQLVGQMAAQIRRIRPPDRYKGKGIRYAGELVQLKQGKGAKKA